jgi:hypothetical protein
VVKVHPEDPMDGIHASLPCIGKIKRFSMARFSTIKTVIYFLPHLVYEAIMQFEPNKVLDKQPAPKRVFTKTKCPNQNNLICVKQRTAL